MQNILRSKNSIRAAAAGTRRYNNNNRDIRISRRISTCLRFFFFFLMGIQKTKS